MKNNKWYWPSGIRGYIFISSKKIDWRMHIYKSVHNFFTACRAAEGQGNYNITL